VEQRVIRRRQYCVSALSGSNSEPCCGKLFGFAGWTTLRAESVSLGKQSVRARCRRRDPKFNPWTDWRNQQASTFRLALKTSVRTYACRTGLQAQPVSKLQSPSSESPGWSMGRGRERSQWNLRSDSLIGRSLMQANRFSINPLTANSQFSFPYERNQFSLSSCHS